MLDPKQLLKSIEPIIGGEKAKKLKLNLLIEAMSERDPNNFCKLIVSLRN